METTTTMTLKSPPCPFCRSEQVTTTSKSPVTQNVYWRCHACGQIWNQARLKVTRLR
jgi:transposase-like protein